MKKNIIIFGTTLVIFSLLIFGFTNKTNSETIVENVTTNKTLASEDQNNNFPNYKSIPDLYYGVDARFAAVKKSDVHKATTIYDFLNDDEKEQITQINSVNLIIIKDNQQSEIQASGTSELLTDAQLKILKSTDYFSHFKIRTDFKGKNTETGKLEDRFFSPHITIVPDKQAIYDDGKEALINYLKDNSKDDMNVIIDEKINAIKISFIVTKQGKVSEVKHDAMTTGYASIDKKLMELIKNIPGKWIPAENSKGEKMEQELIFTFGPKNGC